MARPTSEIDANIDSQRAALAVAYQEIHNGDKGMTTRSVSEILKAIAALEAERATSAALESGTRRVRMIRLSGNSGY